MCWWLSVRPVKLPSLSRQKRIIEEVQMQMTVRFRFQCATRFVFGVFIALLLVACASQSVPVQQKKTGELLWPSPPEEPVIRYIGQLREIEDRKVKNSRFADILAGSEPEKPAQTLAKPFGVTTDASGRVFVADTAIGNLIVFDPKNNLTEQWGASGMGTLGKPIGVAVDGQGQVYVADLDGDRIVVFDAQGRYLRAFGGNDVFRNPVSIAINTQLGRIYVADSKLHQIKIFDLQGNELNTIGKRGGGPAQFNFPSYVSVANDGRVVVSDTLNFRIQILDADGNHLQTFGKVGQNLGDLNRAKGVAFDPDGHVYVADASFSNFQIFDTEGELLLFVGRLGNGPGEFVLPTGVHIDDKGKIYIADAGNHRIQIFEYLGAPNADITQPEGTSPD